ncbi:MAG: double-strand break repair protein AddB [Aestuariivita sp.]|nr:double-strand break repair protein AddB [Aestuariivita sp.]
MFEPTATPRLFAQHPGTDFPRALVEGLRTRMRNKPPDDLARVHLIVNTNRMKTRVGELFSAGPPTLLPKITLVSHLDDLGILFDIPPSMPQLSRQLEISQLVAQLIEKEPDLAARSSAFDLANSLTDLFDEMDEEGVSPSVISDLNVSDQSGHWERAKKFIHIIHQFLKKTSTKPGHQCRQRRIAEALVNHWRISPPEDPIVLAGSTGSRGTTLLLMRAIAELPQGAVILPSFDFQLPESVWQNLSDPQTDEVHPQFGYQNLLSLLETDSSSVRLWHDIEPPSPLRNKVVSLALRPAPVTDAWLNEGPDLGNFRKAFNDVTFIEAPSPRVESRTIALRLRQAVENDETAALITPDQELMRQVIAALDQWNIVPNVGAGQPLSQDPVGQFLRQIARLFYSKLNSSSVLSLLKHPLTFAGPYRDWHLETVLKFELHLRYCGIPYPEAETWNSWDQRPEKTPPNWGDWMVQSILNIQCQTTRHLGEWMVHLYDLATQISSGNATDTSEKAAVWQSTAGKKAKAIIDEIRQSSPYGGELSAVEFSDLFGAVLAQGRVRQEHFTHPDIAIWGTLEARAHGSNLLILGGLNEGTWPVSNFPDAWLSRQMRFDIGLPLPERRVGLSALDFQQAIAAQEVWLTRSIRSAEAQTVPSRWINRLTNLLDGLPECGGGHALHDMRQRGDFWLSQVAALEKPQPLTPAQRPSPCPPITTRPQSLSVTAIKRLIRDPYAIYARQILNLRPLEPLVQIADTRVRGIVVHKIMERFIDAVDQDQCPLESAHLVNVAKNELFNSVPWPITRLTWLIRVESFAEWFIGQEKIRRASAVRLGSEIPGKIDLNDLDFSLTARADRIDMNAAGHLIIYDYKTGYIPSQPDQKKFDKQLLLEAAIAEAGAFDNIPATPVEEAVYIGLRRQPVEKPAPLHEEPVRKIWAEFRQLIAAYRDPTTGYTARLRIQKTSDKGEYDHLARFGEWDDTSTATPVELR